MQLDMRIENMTENKPTKKKRKIRSDKGKKRKSYGPRYYCSGYGWCDIHGEHGP